VIAALLILAVLTYAPHVLFRIGFFSYFVTASVLLTLAIAIAIPILAKRSRARATALVVIVAACWLGAALAGNRHIERWTFRGQPAVHRFAELRSTVQRLSPGTCTMLTFETHIAVETGCDVLPGLEYSFFSYFPDLPNDEAARLGVLNRAAILESLEAGRPEFVLLTTEAVEKIENRPPPATGTTRTLAGEQRRLREEKRASRKKQVKQKRPMLDVMRGRYELLAQEKLPVGPVHKWWTTVYVYARSDLIAPTAGP
jgi:hypothetical protein